MKDTIGKRIRFKNIWDRLYDIPINELHVEDRQISMKGKNVTLYYYQWASCWTELMKHFPDAEYKFTQFEREGKLYDCLYDAHQTATVHCTVTIDGLKRTMWLPVMNFKNDAIKNPDAREISDAKMRCLVKTIAMFGLGARLYDGTYQPSTTDSKTSSDDKKDELLKTPPQEPKKETKIEGDDIERLY
mgnify:CR=1 FL=1